MIHYEEHKDVSIIITDEQRLIIWANQQFTKMTGYSLSEIKGKKPSLLQGRNTEKSAIARIKENLNKEIAFHDRITNYRKNGEEYTCALTIYPIFNLEGNLSNFVAFEVDNNFVNPNDIELMKLDSYTGKKKCLSESEELKIHFELIGFFREEKPYLNPNLSLNEVAKKLNTNIKYLSQVINNQTGKNFKYFVNQFRVQEFQHLVSSKEMQQFTLFSIGQSCGFKNKSTFYNVILNHTGQTPKSISESLKKNS